MRRLLSGTLLYAVFGLFAALALTYLPLSGRSNAIALQALVLIGLAVSANIIGGFAGQLHLGHGAFFGLGAYATAWTMTHLGEGMATPWIGIAAGGLAGLALTPLLIPCFRARGGYFAILTLALTFVLGQLALRYAPGGNSGLFFESLTVGSLSANAAAVGVTTVCLYGAWVSTRGKLGRGMAVVRQDLDAAQGVGVDVVAIRTWAMAVSGGSAGLVGGAYAVNLGFLDPPTAFMLDWSILPLLAVVLGGRGTLVGPVLGAIAWVALDNAAASVGLDAGYSFMLQGALLIIIAMLVPQGLWGIIRGLTWSRRRRPGHRLSGVNTEAEASRQQTGMLT